MNDGSHRPDGSPIDWPAVVGTIARRGRRPTGLSDACHAALQLVAMGVIAEHECFRTFRYEFLDVADHHALTVLSLRWDAQPPTPAGACWINSWEGYYFFGSSEHEWQGPFATLRDTLASISLASRCRNDAVFDAAPSVPLEEILAIARAYCRDQGIYLGGVRHVLRHGELIPAPADDEDAR